MYIYVISLVHIVNRLRRKLDPVRVEQKAIISIFEHAFENVT